MLLASFGKPYILTIEHYEIENLFYKDSLLLFGCGIESWILNSGFKNHMLWICFGNSFLTDRTLNPVFIQ